MRYTPPKPKRRFTILPGVMIDGEPFAFVLEECPGCPDCDEFPVDHNGPSHA